MNIIKLLPAAALCLGLSSCIKDEAPNAECDIEAVSIHLSDPLSVFYNTSDTIQVVASADSIITFTTRRDKVSSINPDSITLTITPGATLKRTSVEMGDNEGTLRYTVTSEDQLWHRDYTLRFVSMVKTVNDTVHYNFENFELESREQKYYIWHDELPDGTYGNNWANGNAGFRLSMGSAAPDAYPTTPLADGYDGYGVRLTTRSTGPFGVLANKRLAAGNLFLGSFDATNAMTNAMKATRFGIPFDRQPVTFKGYYKYTPGESYQDKDGKIVSGTTDSGAIYAVLYRNHDSEGNAIVLYGNDVKTSSQIVAIADMAYVKPTTEWTEFELPFNYLSDIDLTLLQERGYSLAVVFSSSADGDEFRGAIGSELCIDKVQVVCKKEE